MTPQFVEMDVVGWGGMRLVNVNGIKAVSPSREGQRVEVELWGSEEEPWLRVLVEGSYEDWAERLGAARYRLAARRFEAPEVLRP